MGKNDIDSRNLIINDGLVYHVVINQSARSLIFCVIPLVKEACIHKYILHRYLDILDYQIIICLQLDFFKKKISMCFKVCFLRIEKI